MTTKIRIDLFDDRAFAIEIAPATPDDYAYIWSILRGLPEKKWVKSQLCYRVPTTANNIQYLKERFTASEMAISEDASVYIEYQELTEQSAERRERRRWQYLFEDKVPNDVEWVATGPDGEFKPYQHQIVAADALRDTEFFGLLMEQGTGKTAVIINEIVRCALAQEKGSYKVLGIVPTTLVGNWIKELKKCLPADLSVWMKRIEPGANGVYDLVIGMRAKAKLKIWLINPERLRTVQEGLEQMDFDFCFCDESNSIKTPRAKRSKAAIEVAERAKRRAILTGTIMANSILDVFNQFQFLSPGCLGYDGFRTFRYHYSKINKSKAGWDKVVGHRNLDELKERMAKHSFIVKKEQCLDLPPKSYVQLPVQMEGLQAELYEEMLNFAVATLDAGAGESGLMEARAAIAVLVRLAQITSGFIRTPTGMTLRIPGGEIKADTTLDLIRNAEGKVIIWARFREDIRYIVERLDKEGIKSVQIHGGVGNAQRDENVDLFNADNDIRVMVADSGTGGVGLTLLGPDVQRCSTMIYYSHDWSLSKREQSEDRAHRIGQDKKLTIYDLTALGSIDETIVDALLAKRSLSNALKDVSTIRDILLGSGRTNKTMVGARKDTTTLRHLLTATGIEIPCEVGKEDGCDAYDHSEGACPHCDGNPATVGVRTLNRFMQSDTVIGVDAA